MTRRRARPWALTGLPLVFAGCAGLGPDAAAAVQVAERFGAAVAAGDAAQQCALLAPGTIEELESSAGASCAEAIAAEDLPAGGSARDAAAYGRSARVVLDDDVLFLAVFRGDWRVTAAGCVARSQAPYECMLKGG